jgi:hypothetical protein
VGVVQTDGSIHIYEHKRGREAGRKSWRFNLTVAKKSFPMLNKTLKIFCVLFDRHVSTYTLKNGQKGFQTSIDRLMPYFTQWKLKFDSPPTPPSWTKKDVKLFGAYLAGVIDGDGDVTVKRPKYPDCRIRISSAKPPNELKKWIELFFKCKTRIYLQKRRLNGKTYHCHKLSFYVSGKNYEKMKRLVVPNMSVKHKKNKIKKFIKERHEKARKKPGPPKLFFKTLFLVFQFTGFSVHPAFFHAVSINSFRKPSGKTKRRRVGSVGWHGKVFNFFPGKDCLGGVALVLAHHFKRLLSSHVQNPLP